MEWVRCLCIVWGAHTRVIQRWLWSELFQFQCHVPPHQILRDCDCVHTVSLHSSWFFCSEWLVTQMSNWNLKFCCPKCGVNCGSMTWWAVWKRRYWNDVGHFTISSKVQDECSKVLLLECWLKFEWNKLFVCERKGFTVSNSNFRSEVTPVIDKTCSLVDKFSWKEISSDSINSREILELFYSILFLP